MVHSESQITTGLELIGAPVLVFNSAAEITGCNPAAAEILHLGRRELLGRRLFDFPLSITGEDRESIKTEMFPVDRLADKTGMSTRFIFGTGFSLDGPIVWMHGILQRIHNDDGESSFYLTFMDVTELVGNKTAQHQIFQAKNQWETTVDALQDVVTILDKEMRIVRANRKAHELFGYELGELRGKKCYEVFVGRDKPCPRCPVSITVEDAMSHTATIRNEKLQCTFSMSSFPIFDQDGRLNMVVHVARDITQYLKNESEKNRLMAAIEQASESVVISDINGEILYVNPAFEETTGYTRKEVTGRNLNILKSGVHDSSFYAEMWSTLKNKRVWRGRLTNRRKNDTLFKEDVTISPVLDDAGRVVNYVALKRDVTREELLERQIHQSLKMEALGTLAGGIAHDFNNILSAMIGYGEIAKNRLTHEHPARGDLDQMLAGGDRAVDLVKQILTFSRQESYGQFRLFKLQYIIKEIIKLLRPSLPATIELQHHLDMHCRSVFADPGQIYQVVMNLCTNARQAIGDNHGRITIRLAEIKPAESVALGYDDGAETGAFLDLEVTDTGCGIDEETLGRIFDPFFTTKKKEHGTGLGLAVVHGIIKRHRGEIQVTSRPGAGTSFHVFLAVDGREVHDANESESFNPAGNERIMIIDDELQVVNVLKSMLKKAGYSVETYTDPIAAVKQFRQDPGCCDLVITDMVMPNMTGAELTREFLALREGLPIVLMTGHSENFDNDRAQRLGVTEFVHKPLKMNTLYQIVRRALSNG